MHFYALIHTECVKQSLKRYFSSTKYNTCLYIFHFIRAHFNCVFLISITSNDCDKIASSDISCRNLKSCIIRQGRRHYILFSCLYFGFYFICIRTFIEGMSLSWFYLDN